MIKFFWDGPGYYAGYQFDTKYNGSGMFAYYRMDSTEAHDASVEAYERHLGTPRWYDAPPNGAEKEDNMSDTYYTAMFNESFEERVERIENSYVELSCVSFSEGHTEKRYGFGTSSQYVIGYDESGVAEYYQRISDGALSPLKCSRVFRRK